VPYPQAPDQTGRNFNTLLGVNATSPVGFDITPANGTAYATFRAAGTRGTVLYRIDLTNGRATPLGNLGGASLRAMAVRGTLP